MKERKRKAKKNFKGIKKNKKLKNTVFIFLHMKVLPRNHLSSAATTSPHLDKYIPINKILINIKYKKMH